MFAKHSLLGRASVTRQQSSARCPDSSCWIRWQREMRHVATLEKWKRMLLTEDCMARCIARCPSPRLLHVALVFDTHVVGCMVACYNCAISFDCFFCAVSLIRSPTLITWRYLYMFQGWGPRGLSSTSRTVLKDKKSWPWSWSWPRRPLALALAFASSQL